MNALTVLCFGLVVLISLAATSKAEANDPSYDSPRTVRVPFVIDQNRPVISVLVNQVEASLIVDTGSSSAIVLDSRFLPRTDLVQTKRPTSKAIDGGGDHIDVQEARGVRIQFDKETAVDGLRAFVLDLSAFEMSGGIEIDGVLGWGFLKNYVVEIDYRLGTLALFGRNDEMFSRNGIAVHMVTPQTSPSIAVEISDDMSPPAVVPLLVDTGARPILVRKWVGDRADEHRTGTMAVGQGFTREYQGVLIEGGTIRLGDAIIRHLDVTYVKSESAFLNREYEGLLGGGFLKNCRLLLDYRKGYVVFELQETN